MFDASPLPSLENLRCFLAAAEFLNFRRASKAVYLTPAAFGQRIKQLEETLGHDLFTRTTRTVTLTAAGHRLIPVARDTLRQARRCRDAVGEGGELPVYLTVGTRFELGLSWLLPAIRAMPERLAHMELDVYFGSGPDILQRLEDGQLDCVVTSAPKARQDWAADMLHREEYVLVAAPELIATQPLSTLEDAERHTLIDINETLPLSRYLTSVTERPMSFARIRSMGTTAAIRQMTEAGEGVAVLPRYLIHDSLASERLVQLLPDVPLLSDSFRLLYRADTLFADEMARFAGYLRTCALC